MFRRLILQLGVVFITCLLVACFETLEKEEKKGGGGASVITVEEKFKSEIDTLQALSLSDQSLAGLWLAFYSDSGEESSSETFGQYGWTILKISHEQDSGTLEVVNMKSCQTDTPTSHSYAITSVVSGSSFVISNSDSFLYPVANADVFVEIDSSLRKLEFNDFTKAGADANAVSMLAYKFQDTPEESFGSLVLDNDTYSVSCLNYSDSWVLVEATGDDIRQSIEKVSGSGADGNLAFSVEAFVDTSDQSDSSDSITVLVELAGTETNEQFKTVNPDGAVSTVIFNVNSDLTMDAEFTRPGEVSGSMSVSVTQSSIE